jgi:hypothetical protein
VIEPAAQADDVLATLRELYPGRWASLLVELCAPAGPHKHREGACTTPGKRPLAKGWHTKAVERWRAGPPSEDRLRALAAHLERGGNLGLAIPPGVVGLDADTPEASAWLAAALEDGPAQSTARGGHHLAQLDGAVVATCKLEILDGVRVDVRAGERSQIVVEPSTHATGARYTWRRALPERIEDLPACPPLIADALRRAGERVEDRQDYDGGEWNGELPPPVAKILERDPKLRARWSRGKQAGGAENLKDVSALWVDVDYDPENPEGDREAFALALDELGMPPSMRVASGGGEHAYWLLDPPAPLVTGRWEHGGKRSQGPGSGLCPMRKQRRREARILRDGYQPVGPTRFRAPAEVSA